MVDVSDKKYNAIIVHPHLSRRKDNKTKHKRELSVCETENKN